MLQTGQTSGKPHTGPVIWSVLKKLLRRIHPRILPVWFQDLLGRLPV